jgi:universal stress protein G
MKDMSAQKDSTPSYKRILVPYDGSEMSDRALKHASYIAKMADAEMVIMHVIETEYISPSALIGFIRPNEELLDAKERLRASFESGARQMIEEKAKELKTTTGIKVSYKIKGGSKPSDEIVHESEVGMYDLIVMASSRIASSIRVLGSNARRVIDSTRKPVLVIHE